MEPAFDVVQYWDMLKEADINVAVLKPSLSVDSKSEIKWSEAAMFAIPSVLSRTATYSELVREGETGFLCDTVEDWIRALDRLVKDAPLRQEVGRRAQATVRHDYGLEVMAQNLSAIMNEVSPAPPSPKRKVLFVNVFYAPQSVGGATRVLHDNVRRLAATSSSHFELEVFTAVDGATSEFAVESHVQDGVRVTGVTRSAASENAASPTDARMGELFLRHLAASKPDLIHFHCIQRLSLAVVTAAREAGIPYLITVHDAYWISDNQFLIGADDREQTYDYARPLDVLARDGQKSFARMQALRPELFGARHVLGVSQAFSDLHVACGVPNVITAANGVSAIAPAPRVASADGRVRLGHVGGMSRHKGYLLLKYALTKGAFGNLHLTVVDHTRSAGYARQEVWGSTTVTVVAKVEQSEVAGLYAGIDVLMAPSLWAESFGLATREALACGCWVVASDRGAIGSDVVEGVNGHVVDVSDLGGLLAVLGIIDAHAERYRRPPPPTRLRTADEQADELGALYRGLLAADTTVP